MLAGWTWPGVTLYSHREQWQEHGLNMYYRKLPIFGSKIILSLMLKVLDLRSFFPEEINS